MNRVNKDILLRNYTPHSFHGILNLRSKMRRFNSAVQNNLERGLEPFFFSLVDLQNECPQLTDKVTKYSDGELGSHVVSSFTTGRISLPSDIRVLSSSIEIARQQLRNAKAIAEEIGDERIGHLVKNMFNGQSNEQQDLGKYKGRTKENLVIDNELVTRFEPSSPEEIGVVIESFTQKFQSWGHFFVNEYKQVEAILNYDNRELGEIVLKILDDQEITLPNEINILSTWLNNVKEKEQFSQLLMSVSESSPSSKTVGKLVKNYISSLVDEYWTLNSRKLTLTEKIGLLFGFTPKQ